MPRNTKGTVSFKYLGVDVVVRGVKLGADYTAKIIDESIELNLERGISYAKLRLVQENNRADSFLEQAEKKLESDRECKSGK